MGDTILLGGIPAVFFLKHQPREEIQRCTDWESHGH